MFINKQIFYCNKKKLQSKKLQAPTKCIYFIIIFICIMPKLSYQKTDLTKYISKFLFFSYLSLQFRQLSNKNRKIIII